MPKISFVEGALELNPGGLLLPARSRILINTCESTEIRNESSKQLRTMAADERNPSHQDERPPIGHVHIGSLLSVRVR